MKHTLLVIITTLSILSCKAQNPIISLYNGSDFFETQNAYYKDVEGDLQKLIGVWRHTNGNELFEIVLRLQLSYFSNVDGDISFYEDILYGEYRYVDQNGIEILNSLNQIDLSNDPYEHSVYGNYIIDKNHLPVCNSCLQDERRVKVSIKDPERDYFDYDMLIRHFPNDPFGEPEHIVLTIRISDSALIPEGASEEDRLPTYRELTLYKQ